MADRDDGERGSLSEMLGSCCEGDRAKLSRPVAHSDKPLMEDTDLYAVWREAQQDWRMNRPEPDPPPTMDEL